MRSTVLKKVAAQQRWGVTANMNLNTWWSQNAVFGTKRCFTLTFDLTPRDCLNCFFMKSGLLFDFMISKNKGRIFFFLLMQRYGIRSTTVDSVVFELITVSWCDRLIQCLLAQSFCGDEQFLLQFADVTVSLCFHNAELRINVFIFVCGIFLVLYI